MAVTLQLSRVPEPLPDLRRSAELAPIETTHQELAYAAEALVAGYRLHGYRAAAIDPLADRPPDVSRIAELDPRTYGLLVDDSVTLPVELGGAPRDVTLSELLSALRVSYCGSIALECGHVRADEQRRWLHAQMETRIGSASPSESVASRILERLVATETFEHYLRANHPKYKQFSMEGSESLVPLLRAAIEQAVRQGVEAVVLGMPHRGRLNMMLNALDVPAAQLLSLYSPNPDPALAASDLKDHAGLSTRVRTAYGEIDLLLAHNPSHLESVSPVVCGIARALQDRKTDASSRKVLPVLIHGDASFSGQGVVAETLNLSQTRGYSIGGTLHVILDNQIGSTVSHPRDQRSTLYCADVARLVDAPVLHVNADDPDAVTTAARLATDYRIRFGTDIVVDHVGYRRYGHFVGDDPTITEPAMQRRIRRHRSVVRLYAEKLAARGLVREGELERLKTAAMSVLIEARPVAATARVAAAPAEIGPQAARQAIPVVSAVPLSQLQTILRRLTTVPQAFALHASVEKMLEDWRMVASDDDRPVDWRLAENLAYATLLANGFNIRLTGLDVGRGTFGHRQHFWHDQAADRDWQNSYVPLRHVAEAQGMFSIFESPLSEEAVVGFEYGYSLRCGRDLVVWEAQFGDFVNNAQVMIDQYIATGEAKWGYKSGLVMQLPHGHDGWGPEHSCALLGRFLQLCADGNLQVAMPSTAAQAFHLLRRQALMQERKPLIVMTPKPWFYGHQPSYSRLPDLAQGAFLPLLGERVEIDPTQVSRAIVTSGKLYYDLSAERSKAGLQNVPILRVEQLYPFPGDALAEALGRFPRLRGVVWAQEEAKNHGAWYPLRERLEAALPPGAALTYAGRPAMAPAAVGDATQNAAEQRDIARRALGIAPAP
jgi:2-oxoglutarate dehydrogenase E1 component